MKKFLATLIFVVAGAGIAHAENLQILLPLDRTAYQTNERIDISVVRSAPAALPAGDLVMTLAGDANDTLSFTFPLAEVPAVDGLARATEHLHLDGRLLRPGDYVLTIAADGATAQTPLKVRSHVRRSTFKVINWGSRAKADEQVWLGEDSLGFNFLYSQGLTAAGDGSILGGLDWMQVCTMSGGHQMDIRMECCWSDPYVIRGGAARVARAAFAHRRTPNAVGVNFYDEPGLTWHRHPDTDIMTPHNIPAQMRAYRAAFGVEPLQYHEVDPNNPEHVAQWTHWANWKLSFMEANWKTARFAVEYVRPDYITATQSQYGWTAFTDGYYFNVVRSLPVTSGHGGYDNYWLGLFNPSFFLEMSRARDLEAPCWYLPTWYVTTPSDSFRLQQYLSFITNIQGLATPPWLNVHDIHKVKPADGIVESNRLTARLGTIFNTMPVTRPPVAMLYSMSHNIRNQVHNMSDNYAGGKQRDGLTYTYLAGKLIHNPFQAVVEEDILDGTLELHHRALVITNVDYLDTKVLAAIETFIEDGGIVMLTADCKVEIAGARKLKSRAAHHDEETVKRLQAEKKDEEVRALTAEGHLLRSARPLAEEIRGILDAAGIEPVVLCDNSEIIVSRQAYGDVEYIFAVNASYDYDDGAWNAMKATSARFALPNDGRPVYDAVLGAPANFQPEGDYLRSEYRFGPGQMRVFARTATAIANVQAARPQVHVEYAARASYPISVRVAASVVDAEGGIISGSIPMRIQMSDPQGVVRYDLYRATANGIVGETLPLGVNDPVGEWSVKFTELLTGANGDATFTLEMPRRSGATAGAAHRAVHFDLDRENIYRFFRTNRNVIIARGTGTYNEAAAYRLAEALRPWDVHSETLDAADIGPRSLTEEEARTWVGIHYAGSGGIKPGDANNPRHVLFDLRKPVILLGNPEDNKLIAFLLAENYLPYKPEKDTFPGRGRGYIAWQRDGVAFEQESITLIAYDEAGMAEAVGSLYEAMHGMQPLNRWRLPLASSIKQAETTPAVTRVELASATAGVWQAIIPDAAIGMRVEGNSVRILSKDGTISTIENGRVAGTQFIEWGDMPAAVDEWTQPRQAEVPENLQRADRVPKFLLTAGESTAVAYWGGMLAIQNAGAVRHIQLEQDVSAMAIVGGRLVTALADGRVIGWEMN